MKGKIIVTSFLLAAIALFFVLRFVNINKTLANYSDTEIKRIEEAFTKYYDSDVKLSIDKKAETLSNSYGTRTDFYGIYNGCVVFYMETMIEDDAKEIAGYKFENVFSENGSEIFVYNKGIFVNLQTAYKLGWLNKSQIKKIHEVHNKTKR